MDHDSHKGVRSNVTQMSLEPRIWTISRSPPTQYGSVNSTCRYRCKRQIPDSARSYSRGNTRLADHLMRHRQ
ncbi:hypothetical protein HZ326_7620 [Fusarium oxysporum f. sp. albedinis]|nr:hypothetical protein HZ326_7620 [Fusarium oxysporum f. sp. albedinis]